MSGFGAHYIRGLTVLLFILKQVPEHKPFILNMAVTITAASNLIFIMRLPPHGKMVFILKQTMGITSYPYIPIATTVFWNWMDFTRYKYIWNKTVLKIRTICHAKDLQKLALTWKQMYLPCLLKPMKFTRYCLTQWISKLPGSFDIHWVKQYLINVVSFGIKDL